VRERNSAAIILEIEVHIWSSYYLRKRHIKAKTLILIVYYIFNCKQKLKVRHLLDVMHCKNNIYKNILKYLIGKKDKPQMHNNMEQHGIRSHLHLRVVDSTSTSSIIFV
jgi:hypothetical protein